MPAFPSPTSYALLGLLSVRSWTTYELTQQVKRSLRWFWPRAERQLYVEAKRLVEHGLADVEERYVGKRRSRDYGITEEGRTALAAWPDEPPSPRTTEFEGMVKVFFADAGTREQLLGTLERIEAEALERIEAVAALSEPTTFEKRRHVQSLCLPFELGQEEAALRWARWAREQVLAWESTSEPGDWDVDGARQQTAARAAQLLAEGSAEQPDEGPARG
jgi:PadR family transcriptional regulator, regulatory protein AphA